MRNTWVIGGMSGIGNEIAEMLYRGIPDGVAHNVNSTSENMVDVTNISSILDYVVRAGHIDNVVYCAGIQRLGLLGELDTDDVRDIINVNLIGFINVMHALAQRQKNKYTNVVAIVSDASKVPMRGSIAYCASKAGLAHAIRVAAREMAPFWRVNGVSPGVVDDTPMTDYIDETVPKLRGWTLEEAKAYETSLIPMGRRATKKEVAKLVQAVLLGPQYLTGSIIDITGGK